jgi:hypothetical protein
MKSTIYLWSVLASLAALGLGCEVTSEKIGVWKQSENGAPKLRAAVRDRKQSIPIRVEAAEALCDNGLFAPLADDFKAVAAASEQDAKQIMADLVKRLLDKMKGSNPKATSKVQLQAKDSLFSLRELADEATRKNVDEELLRWVLLDFRERSTGEHSADKVIAVIGVRSGPLLAERLGADPALVVPLATHLRAVGDAAAREAGAERLIELARRQTSPEELPKTLEALGKVGSVKAVSYLAQIANKGDLNQRRLALRALALFPHVSVVALAKGVAADSTLKGEEAELRDDAFALLEKIDDPSSLDALVSLATSKEEKVRYQAVEATVGGFKEKGLTKLLEALPSSYTYKKQDVKDFIEDDIVKLGKGAVPVMRKALGSQSWVARVVAIHVLGRLGTKEDVAALEKLTSDQTKLRGWEAGATVGTEAKAAADMIQSRK